MLYQTVVEIDERVTLEDYTEHPEREITILDKNKDSDLVRGLSGEVVRILQRPREEQIREELQKLYDEGYRSIAVCLVHSYTFPEHELLVGKIAESLGFTHISLSSQLMPMIKLVPRATSATADAYLTPEIRRYVSGFEKGFIGGLGKNSVKKAGTKGAARCEFMQRQGFSNTPLLLKAHG